MARVLASPMSLIGRSRRAFRNSRASGAAPASRRSSGHPRKRSQRALAFRRGAQLSPPSSWYAAKHMGSGKRLGGTPGSRCLGPSPQNSPCAPQASAKPLLLYQHPLFLLDRLDTLDRLDIPIKPLMAKNPIRFTPRLPRLIRLIGLFCLRAP